MNTMAALEQTADVREIVNNLTIDWMTRAASYHFSFLENTEGLGAYLLVSISNAFWDAGL